MKRPMLKGMALLAVAAGGWSHSSHAQSLTTVDPGGTSGQSLVSDCTRPRRFGSWSCRAGWSAWNTQRAIKGPTDFECVCGVPFHSCGPSTVDISGGLSQQCNDNPESFFGPLSDGEWNGCKSAQTDQYSFGMHRIDGINQGWDRWPQTWASRNYGEVDLSYLTRTDYMQQPFASIYDLDRCINKQHINTLYWPNFPVTATLVSGDPAAAKKDRYSYATVVWALRGSTPFLCSDQDGILADANEFGSKRSPVCSDLIVEGTYTCNYTPPDCRTGECEDCL